MFTQILGDIILKLRLWQIAYIIGMAIVFSMMALDALGLHYDWIPILELLGGVLLIAGSCEAFVICIEGIANNMQMTDYVAGIYADLYGRIIHLDKPELTIWTGTATYKILGGLLRFRLPEGGVLKMINVPEGTKVSHNVYIDFPNSLWGKFLKWFFLKF